MNYGRIRRGPMAADAFTQIRNTLFRDNRISFKAKGVFGLISTHRDGYGVTPESLAACSTDGVSAVKAALRELEAAKYLKRARERRPDGTLGAATYYITDEPEALQLTFEEETPRSEPADENPPVDKPPVAKPPVVQPPVDEPTVANRPHKKTNSKHTSGKKTLSPRVPKPRPAGTPAPPVEEREKNSSPGANTVVAAYIEALGRPISTEARSKFREQALSLLADGFPVAWLADRARELAAKGWADLAKHCDHSTVPTTRKPTDSKSDWCGQCDDPNYRMRRDPARGGELVECDTCNHAAVARRRRAEEGAAA